jgi:hypothetical protein
MTGQVVPFPVIPIVPGGAGLTPGDVSSVAPMGIPVGATGELGDMPSGEVAPILGVGLPIPPTCATAGVQLKRAACIAAINTRRMSSLHQSLTLPAPSGYPGLAPRPSRPRVPE